MNRLHFLCVLCKYFIIYQKIFCYLSQADRHCLVAIEEFQQITHYDRGENIEATLRTVFSPAGIVQPCLVNCFACFFMYFVQDSETLFCAK